MKILALFALLALPANTLICQSGCGIVPIRPITPIGCKSLKPECVCDSRGANCQWRWVCVPNR